MRLTSLLNRSPLTSRRRHTSSLLLNPRPRSIRARSNTASAAAAAAPVMSGTIRVSSDFDSGNIDVVEARPDGLLRLNMRPEPYCETDKRAHFQWFNFRVMGARGTQLKIDILNAGQASYPLAWEGYQACASYDLQHWFRVPTAYDSGPGVLTISHTPDHDSVQYAYFAPYTQEQHMRLVHRMQSKAGVSLEVLGQSVDGRDIELLIVGQPGPGKRNIWVIARQHPGETQAEYFVEGLLERLTGSGAGDAARQGLLDQAVFYVVPNMNPDGSFRGHLRTNAAGMNLNRAWESPCPRTSPEVLVVLNRMKQTGVDFLMDVHGDEALPHCFVAGLNGIPGWDERLQLLQHEFCEAYKRANGAFQTTHGYAMDAPGKANMTLCSKQVGQQFNCLSLTLEMPFKDCADAPDPLQGWSPESSARLGADLLTAVWEVLPKLRA